MEGWPIQAAFGLNGPPQTGLVLVLLILGSSLLAQGETTAQAALSSALRGTPAVAVVLDVSSGHTIAVVNPTEAQSLRSTPGSILKPLFLAAALEGKQVSPQTTVFCRRTLRIHEADREWDLDCTHPQTGVSFAAREALAYSCNRYFAQLADRVSPQQAEQILEHYGLTQVRHPVDREQKELLVLGVDGISVSPMQMATAWRKLTVRLNQGSPALEPVRSGLKDSVDYGMAHNASVPGFAIAGKTGTAGDAPGASSHGWFAGTGFLGERQLVTVVYLPHGNGADAATLARRFFLATAPAGPPAARALIVQLFSTQTIKTLTLTSRTGQAPLRIDWRVDGLHPSSGATVHQLNLSGSFHLQPEDVSAAGQWTIRWRRDGLRVFLTMPSEQYVAAALNGEAAADEPFASLEAMAISIRTFALVNANRHSAEGFGLCDSTHCQALRLGQPRPDVLRAVRETAGETLWIGGQRAHVYYTQHCGGKSEAADAVWPKEQAPYLNQVHDDPYCLRRSSAEWQAHIPLDQLTRIFRAQGWQTPPAIDSVRINRRTASGRADLLEVTGRGAPAQLSAGSFRFAVDRALGWNQVRSDWYSLRVSEGQLEILGHGYGHGVGLCQAGAWQMAAEGHSTSEILSFYFPGVVSGITASDQGWQRFAGSGWTLLTTSGPGNLLAQGNTVWARAQSLMGSAGAVAPTVEELPTTELFRQTTGEPGWMLASTQNNLIFLQPPAVRQSNGGAEPLLLHEFLHVLVEREAREKAPLWLREGLVETLADPDEHPAVEMQPAQVDALLSHPTSAAESRRAHLAAARMARLLCDRYGLPAVRGFLHNGVPPSILKLR